MASHSQRTDAHHTIAASAKAGIATSWADRERATSESAADAPGIGPTQRRSVRTSSGRWSKAGLRSWCRCFTHRTTWPSATPSHRPIRGVCGLPAYRLWSLSTARKATRRAGCRARRSQAAARRRAGRYRLAEACGTGAHRWRADRLPERCHRQARAGPGCPAQSHAAGGHAEVQRPLHGGRGQQDGGQCPGACRHQGRASPDAAGPGGGAVARDAQAAAASRQVGCLGGRPPSTACRRQVRFADWRAPPKPLARRRTWRPVARWLAGCRSRLLRAGASLDRQRPSTGLPALGRRPDPCCAAPRLAAPCLRPRRGLW